MLCDMDGNFLNRYKSKRCVKMIYILYALFPDENRINALKFFLKHVNRTKHEIKIFVIENSGPKSVKDILPTEIIFVQRENVNLDFGAWKTVFEKLELKDEDFVFFINDTVYGPFVKPGVDWVQLYLDAFLPEVAVVCSTMICLKTEKTPLPGTTLHDVCGKYGRKPFPAIQSSSFMINHLGFSAMKEIFSFLDGKTLSYEEIIVNCECRISAEVYKRNYNINTMLMEYAGKDYRKDSVIDPTANPYGDINYPGRYNGTTIHPLESVFVKWTKGRTDLRILNNYIGWAERTVSPVIKQSTIYILYALFPSEERIDALKFFLTHVFKTKHKLKIYVIENLGPKTVAGSLSSFSEDPEQITFISRENINGDFGAWAYATDNLGIELKDDDYLMLVNDTVYGPIVKPGVDWADLFISAFLPEVGLVSTTICCHTLPEVTRKYGRHPFPTIQSMCFMINKLGWTALMETFDLVKEKKMEHWEMAVKCEFGISKRLFDQGLNINCMLMGYANVDYRKTYVDDQSSLRAVGETSYPGCYFGTTIHPLELVFVKWNRGRTDTRVLKNYLTWIK